VPDGGVLADLGAGTGRCAATCALLRPDVTCHSFELVAGRVTLARRARRRLGVKRDRCPIVRRNLATSRHPLPPADLYFMFSPFSPATLRVVLGGLRAHAARRPRFLLVLKAMEWMDEAEEGAHDVLYSMDANERRRFLNDVDEAIWRSCEEMRLQEEKALKASLVLTLQASLELDREQPQHQHQRLPPPQQPSSQVFGFGYNGHGQRLCQQHGLCGRSALIVLDEPQSDVVSRNVGQPEVLWH